MVGRYKDVPYHNRVHAADVVSRVAAILAKEGICQDDSIHSQSCLLAVILAATIHDFEHPGKVTLKTI